MTYVTGGHLWPKRCHRCLDVTLFTSHLSISLVTCGLLWHISRSKLRHFVGKNLDTLEHGNHVMIFHYDIPYHHHHHYMTHLPTVEVEYGVHDYCPGELCLGESKRSQNLKLMTWVIEWVGGLGWNPTTRIPNSCNAPASSSSVTKNVHGDISGTTRGIIDRILENKW